MSDLVSTEQRSWFEWLKQEQALAERIEELVMEAVRILEMNERFLYVKATTDLTQLTNGEIRIMQALSRQGDTVVIAVGPDPEHIRLSYRMPDLANAVAFDLDGLRGLIQQWSVWAATQNRAA